MAVARIALTDFALENGYYAGASVAVYEVDDDYEKTATLATLYAGLTGTTLLPNPQALDSRGKWMQPVYVDTNVVLTVTRENDVDDTGVVQVPHAGQIEYKPPQFAYINSGITVEKKLERMGFYLHDFGGGVNVENNSPAMKRLFAEYARYDPAGSRGASMILDKAEDSGVWSFADPVVIPRALSITSVNGLNSAVLNARRDTAWPSSPMTFPNPQCWINDVQMSGSEMESSDPPLITIPSGGELNWRTGNLDTGPAVGMLVQGDLNAWDLAISTGSFGLNATANMGIIEVSGSARVVWDGGIINGVGDPQNCAGLKVTSARYVRLSGHFVSQNIRYAFRIAPAGSSTIRTFDFDGTLLVRNGYAGSHAIEFAPANTSRIYYARIGSVSMDVAAATPGAGLVRTTGAGHINSLFIGPTYAERHSGYALDLRNNDVLEVHDPKSCAGAGGLYIGGNVVDESPRALRSVKVVGGHIGPLGDRDGNTVGMTIVEATMPEWVSVQGLYCAGNDTDWNNPTGTIGSIDIYLTEGRTIRPKAPLLPYVHIAGTDSNGREHLRMIPPACFFRNDPAGTHGIAGTAATGSTTYSVKKNGVAFGTLVWAAAGTIATTLIASTTFNGTSDVLTIEGPATADATLANIGIQLVADLTGDIT